MNGIHTTRRTIIKGLGASVALPFFAKRAYAQDADLGAYQSAKINWRQTEGENLTIAVIPAGYFENLITLAPQFTALTGVNVRFEKVPPAQIRQKAVLDLTSGTATYATHAADPMYYPLYQANGWVEDLTPYLDNPDLTDKAWFDVGDIVPAWLSANSIDGKVYGIPYDGEVTLQVLRKDLLEAKGLKPAEDLDTFLANAKELHAPNDRVWGTALRGVAGAGQNVYIYASLFRSFGGNWFAGDKLTINGAEAEAALSWYVDTMKTYAPGCSPELELARYCRRLLTGYAGELYRRSFLGIRHQQSRKVSGDRQDRLCPLAEGPLGQARQLDLELGISDQCQALGRPEEGHLAVHPVGCKPGNPDPHVLQLGRCDQALRRQPALALERRELYRNGQPVRRQFCRGDARGTAGGHRCRLASAGPAMAGRWRCGGNRSRIGARRAGQPQGCARCRPATCRRLHEVTWSRLRRRR